MCTVGGSSVRARRDGVVGRRVRCGVHGVVRSVLGRRRWPLHVRALWMSKHARCAVAASRVVSAGDHASYVRRRKVPQSRRVLVGRHMGRRSIVRHCTVRHHRWRYRHRRVVVGRGRGRVVPVRGRVDVVDVYGLLLGVRTVRLRRRVLSHLALRCRDQAQDDWVRGVGLRRTLAGRVRGIGSCGNNHGINPSAHGLDALKASHVPLSSSIRTTSTCPFFTASMRGVTPV